MSVNLRSSCLASFFLANSSTSCGLIHPPWWGYSGGIAVVAVGLRIAHRSLPGQVELHIVARVERCRVRQFRQNTQHRPRSGTDAPLPAPPAVHNVMYTVH